jgi:hypothetical protein
MAAMESLKASVAAACVLLLLATGYLSLSLIVLNPPRADFPLWFTMAVVFVVQSVLTLVASTARRPPAALRAVVAVGACALIGIAIWRLRATLNSTHFEGYNLLLGAMLVVQGALTLAAFARSAHQAVD